jgi:tetratricopeptide (TPR) repeat protein
VESQTDRPHPDHPESPSKSDAFQAGDRAAFAYMAQNVQGDRNQAIGSVTGGTVAYNIENFTQYTQQGSPRFLSKHQLPPDIADFTGRTQKLEQVLTVLRQANPRTKVAISGMAGVGKSALALRVAHALSAEFDEVQLYVNLRGSEGHQALDPAMVLVDWLRALGRDDTSIPAELEARSQTYRSLLQGKRAIVLLDNAQNEAQIRPLLPGSSTCAVLITSRKKLVALQGAHPLDLSVLPEDEALSLLKALMDSTRIDAEPEQAKAILALCGRLPLAIRIAAGTLNKPSQQRKSLAEYVHQLQDEKQRLTQLHLDHLEENLDIRTSFELSYRELSDDLSSLFRWLGLLDAPDFGVGVAAVLIETDEETAQQQIDSLVDAQLLEIVAEGRYRFHDLIRLFAREKLDEAESSEQKTIVQQRVIQYFLEQVSFAITLTHPATRHQILDALIASDPTLFLEQTEQDLERGVLAWLEQEHLTLFSLVNWIVQFETGEDLITLDGLLAEFLHQRFYLLDAEKLHRQALRAARKLGDRQAEEEILICLGNVYEEQGKWNEAIDFYQQSREICRKLGNRNAELGIIQNMGSIYSSQGKWDEAIDFLQRSVDGFRDMGDRRREGQTLCNLGDIYRKQGRWNEAFACFQESLNICQDFGDRYEESTTLRNLGLLYQDLGELEEAIKYYQQSCDIGRKLINRHVEGQGLINLGGVYCLQGKYDDAIQCCQQSLHIMRELSDRDNEGKILGKLGVAYGNQGKWDEAIDFYHQSLGIVRELGDRLGESKILDCLGLHYSNQGKWDKAIDYLQQNLGISQEVGDRSREGQTLYYLGLSYLLQGQWDKAIESYQQSLEIRRELGEHFEESAVLDCLAGVYQAHGEWDEAVNFLQQNLEIMRELGEHSEESVILGRLAAVYREQGKWDEVIDSYQKSLEIKRVVGDRYGESAILYNLGLVYPAQNKWDEAIDYLQQSLGIYQELGDRHKEGCVLGSLGIIYNFQGNREKAKHLWQNALRKFHPNSPEFNTVTEWLQAAEPPRCSRWLPLMTWLVVGLGLVFVVSNLLAGRWWVALLIVGVAGMAWGVVRFMVRVSMRS